MLGGGARRATSSPAPSGGGSSPDLHATSRLLMRAHFPSADRIAHVISPELLEVLACPKCKQKVELDEEGSALVCQTDRLRYPIVDGIPVMLIDEAKSF
jgi:uncharacterized protein YbaR (Trm112 family)